MEENRPALGAEDAQLLADSLLEGIVLLSADEAVTWWNQAAGQLLGLRVQHRNLLINKVLKGSGMRTLMKGQVESVDVIRKVGRKILHLSCSLVPYRSSMHLLVVQDVTRAREQEIIRKDFIANVSHELRTPLTVFRGYLELLQFESDQVINQQPAMLQQMSDQCDRMEKVVKDLLLLTRLENEEVNVDMRQLVDIPNLIAELVLDAKQLGKAKSQCFILDIDSTLKMECSEFEIRSAFSNIIYNAVRYTRDHGEFTIRWYRSDLNERVFSVTDTGPGIAVKHLDKITRRFYRIDPARSRDRGGTGLGLAIVKHVMLRHAGELDIKSQVGQGSTFSCVFPDGSGG